MANCKYDKRKPHRLDYFMKNPNVMFSLYQPMGKVVSLGCRSVEHAKVAHEQLVMYLIELGLNHDDYDLMSSSNETPTTCNISSAGYLGHGVNLDDMANAYDDNAIFVRESFPGLRFKRLVPEISPSINATVFASGKVILLGCKRELDILTAYERLVRITTPFARGEIVQDQVVETNIVHFEKRIVVYSVTS